MKIAHEEYLINTNLNQCWINLLCKYGNKEEFNKINQESISTPLAIMKYRRILRGRGYGEISLAELNDAYINKKYKKLHTLLEVMFLEFIPDSKFDYILDKINNTEDGLQKLYNIHQEEKGTRVLSIALVL